MGHSSLLLIYFQSIAAIYNASPSGRLIHHSSGKQNTTISPVVTGIHPAIQGNTQLGLPTTALTPNDCYVSPVSHGFVRIALCISRNRYRA